MILKVEGAGLISYSSLSHLSGNLLLGDEPSYHKHSVLHTGTLLQTFWSELQVLPEPNLFPSGFPTSILHVIIFFPICATCPSHLWIYHSNYITQIVQLFFLFSDYVYNPNKARMEKALRAVARSLKGTNPRGCKVTNTTGVTLKQACSHHNPDTIHCGRSLNYYSYSVITPLTTTRIHYCYSKYHQLPIR
jgi:hypothetical protein